MKKYINIFSLLVLLNGFSFSLAMQQEDVEEKGDVVSELWVEEQDKSEILLREPIEVPTLLELAVIPLANQAINTYDEHDLNVMIDYLSNLQLPTGQKMPVDLIDRIYYAIIKILKRGDILVHRLFSMYEHSEKTDAAQRIEGSVNFLAYASKEISNVLVADFAQKIAMPIASINRENFENFARALIMHGDINWLAKLRRSLEDYQFGECEEIVLEMRDAIANRIDELVQKVSIEERKKVQENKKIAISDDHIKLAKRLVCEVQGDNFEVDETLETDLNQLDSHELNRVISYILVNYIDEFQDKISEEDVFLDGESCNGYDAFVGLFDFLGSGKRIEVMDLVLEEIVQDYPQTVGLMYLRLDIPGIAKLIKYIQEEVCSSVQSELSNLLWSEEENVAKAIIDVIYKSNQRFGIQFVAILLKNVFKNLLPARDSFLLGHEVICLEDMYRMARILQEVVDILGSAQSDTDIKIGRSISKALVIIEAWKKDESVGCILSQIEALFEELMY